MQRLGHIDFREGFANPENGELADDLRRLVEDSLPGCRVTRISNRIILSGDALKPGLVEEVVDRMNGLYPGADAKYCAPETGDRHTDATKYVRQWRFSPKKGVDEIVRDYHRELFDEHAPEDADGLRESAELCGAVIAAVKPNGTRKAHIVEYVEGFYRVCGHTVDHVARQLRAHGILELRGWGAGARWHRAENH